MENFRCGFVALIGRPNVGKSTLLNTIIGQKISIVSNKVQTTRRQLLGILTEENHQAIFVDTPGVHKPLTHLGKILNETTQRALSDVDVVLAVVDSSTPPGKDDTSIAKMIESALEYSKKPILLCLNKMDLLKAENVVEHVESYCELFKTKQYMFTSSTKNQNIDKLKNLIFQILPEGPSIFPEDTLTDLPMRILAAEIVREKALHLTKKEVPYGIATLVDLWEEQPESNLTRIELSIVVERESQKGILIGKHGSMLKAIGTAARIEIESFLGHKVFLKLFVKVRVDWRQNLRYLSDFGYL